MGQSPPDLLPQRVLGISCSSGRSVWVSRNSLALQSARAWMKLGVLAMVS